MASKEIKDTVHAMLNPSGCHRWAYCPASVLLTKDLPNDSSTYAQEGTKAHRYAELMLDALFNSNASLAAVEEAEGIKSEVPDVAEQVKKYTDEIVATERDKEVLFHAFEKQFSMAPITLEYGAVGTCDCVTLVRGRDNPEEAPVLHIFDLKYGVGVKVDAAENPQLGMYALAALAELDEGAMFFGIEKVVLHIVQPRLDNVSEWAVSRAGLEGKFLNSIRRASSRAMELVQNPDRLVKDWPFVPVVEERVTYDEAMRTGKVERIQVDSRGDFSSPANAETVCKWCRAKASCPILAKQLADTIAQDFEDLPEESVPTNVPAEVRAELKEIPVPDTPERVAAAFRYIPMIRDWCDAVEDSARNRLRIGETLPGLKLVAGRQGPRKWSDAKEAEEILRRALRVDSVYDRKVISPTTAEKLMKEGLVGPRYWTKLSALISRSDGKPCVVSTDDPREAITPQIEKDFD